LRLILIAFALAALSSFAPAIAMSLGVQQVESILTVDPSSIVVKVGQSARANITLMGSSLSRGVVCFNIEGFPTSGFVTSIDPKCWKTEPSRTSVSILTVEATPAAAPQSFTALVVANSGNWAEKVPISIIVEPAMPAWIPWSIILTFILILVSPLVVKKRKSKARRRMR